MRVPQLDIQQTPAKIAVQHTKGQLKVKFDLQPLELDYNTDRPYQTLPDLKIENPAADFKIDQKQTLADIGLRDYYGLVKNLKKKSYRKTIKAIHEIASEGDFLARIEDKGNRIAQLAKNEYKGEKREMTVISLPEHPPRVKAKAGKVKVDIEPDPVKIKVENNYTYPSIVADPGRVKVYLAQKEKVEISVKSREIDLTI